MNDYVAVDFHVHTCDVKTRTERSGEDFVKAIEKYFGGESVDISMDQMAQKYQSQNMAAVVIGWDAETATGLPPTPNDLIAEYARTYPKTFVGFAGIDPWKGKAAITELERSVDLGLCGVKFHPIAQAFFANDPRFWPLWERCQQLGMPCLFHVGNTGWRAGIPGGGGSQLVYGQPIPYLDDVAARFPELKMVLAHPAFPWTDQALAMAMNKSNVFLDLSGYSPKYFSPTQVQYCRTLLRGKSLFGSDMPALTPERWLADFEALGYPDDVKRMILRDNARKVLTHPNAKPLVDAIWGGNASGS